MTAPIISSKLGTPTKVDDAIVDFVQEYRREYLDVIEEEQRGSLEKGIEEMLREYLARFRSYDETYAIGDIYISERTVKIADKRSGLSYNRYNERGVVLIHFMQNPYRLYTAKELSIEARLPQETARNSIMHVTDRLNEHSQEFRIHRVCDPMDTRKRLYVLTRKEDIVYGDIIYTKEKVYVQGVEICETKSDSGVALKQMLDTNEPMEIDQDKLQALQEAMRIINNQSSYYKANKDENTIFLTRLGRREWWNLYGKVTRTEKSK
jgi:hypothetical protein